MQNSNNNLRPSALPKLALCGQFESQPGTSDAAARGTRIDSLFRHMWTTGEIPDGADMDEVKVAHWACGSLLKLGNNGMTTTSERMCRIFVPIIDKWGTMDAVNLASNWLADLKTGQMHNYREQMAAYALGCMEVMQEEHWTAHLLFADQQEVVTHAFTRRQAREIVKEAVDNVGTDPTPNEYCQWCSKALTCKPRLADQEAAIATTEDAANFTAVLNDPDRLGLFLSRAKVFDEFREAAKEKAREYLEAGERVAGWRLQKPRVSETLDVPAQLASGLPLEALLTAHGPISAKKAREIGPIDESTVTRKTSRPILSQI